MQKIERRQKIWIPLESNPRLYTEYAEKLGFRTELYRFYDIFSTDPEIWQNYIPTPIISVVLLYQVNKNKDMLYPDNVYYLPREDVSQQPFFIRQTIGNACGTVALLHALCNNEDKIEGGRGFVKDSFLDNFVNKFRNSDPQDRADFLYEDVLVEENHQKIADASEAKSNTTQQEQTENPEDVKSD